MTPRVRLQLAAALVPPVLLITCSQSGSIPGSDVVIDTLPSGVPVVSGPAEGLWPLGGEWRLTERLRLGSSDEAGPELFGEIWDVELDAYGRIYVLDRMAKEVRVFGQDGSFIRAFGGAGEGPGEFQDPFGLAWSADGNLWVVDVRLSRYSVFDTSGAHLREYRRRVGGYSWPWPGRFDEAGTLYEVSLAAGDPDPLVAFTPADELIRGDSFPNALTRPESTNFWDLRNERGIGAFVAIPFGRSSEWVLDSEAAIWVGHSRDYSIAKRTLTGDTILLIVRRTDAVAVSKRERDREIERLDEYASHPKMDLSSIPSTKPFFRRLIPDDDGNLWVLREGRDEDWFFDVFNDEGVYLGAVGLPVTPSLFPPPLVRSGMVLVVTGGEFDVQYVVAYEIGRP